MKKINKMAVLFIVAVSVVLLGTMNGAIINKWFVMGEQVLKSADPSVEIKTTGGRWSKDIKKVKLSVEGADVQMTKVVLRWDNRADDTVTPGTIKAGGETAPKDAPGLKGRLKAVVIQYKILNKATTATVKIHGFD
jgi:hypothetical protein